MEEIPPGWSANPSSPPQRLPIIALALLGAASAGYLTLYQARVIENVWEPFFGRGSEVILDSWVSHVLPIPDAALGALAYVVDAVAGAIGGRARWRTMPWMVILFGIAIGPLGAVSVLLVVLQPVLFDAWCTLCLASAGISVAMIGPALDEVLATLMAAPAVLAYGDPARSHDRVVGPLIASIAFVACWEVARGLRRVNSVLGAWLLLAPWVIGHAGMATLNALLTGLFVVALSSVRGRIAQRFGGGWGAVRRRTKTGA